MERLFALCREKVTETETDFVRYMHAKINWNSRLIVIVGTRGVGKTGKQIQGTDDETTGGGVFLKIFQADSPSHLYSFSSIFPSCYPTCPVFVHCT